MQFTKTLRSAEVTHNTSVTEAQRLLKKVEPLYEMMSDAEAAKCAILSISTKSNIGTQGCLYMPVGSHHLKFFLLFCHCSQVRYLGQGNMLCYLRNFLKTK